MLRVGDCTPGCGACCRDIWLEVSPVYTTPDLKHWLVLHGVDVSVRDGVTWAHIALPCSQLTPEGMCSAFDTPLRPQICEEFPVFPEQLSMCGLTEKCSYKFIPLEEVANAH